MCVCVREVCLCVCVCVCVQKGFRKEREIEGDTRKKNQHCFFCKFTQKEKQVLVLITAN